MLRPRGLLTLIAVAAVFGTAAGGPVLAGSRPDTTAASRLAPWNAPDPFCRKNCDTNKACSSAAAARDAQKSAAQSRGPTRWRR